MRPENDGNYTPTTGPSPSGAALDRNSVLAVRMQLRMGYLRSFVDSSLIEIQQRNEQAEAESNQVRQSGRLRVMPARSKMRISRLREANGQTDMTLDRPVTVSLCRF
jgi:hypothetical protein